MAARQTAVMANVPTLVFMERERTYTCSTGPRLRSESTLWWWFTVSDGNTSRYAPFAVSGDDTDASVQQRIVAYYEEHLARRAAPPVSRYRRAAS